MAEAQNQAEMRVQTSASRKNSDSAFINNNRSSLKSLKDLKKRRPIIIIINKLASRNFSDSQKNRRGAGVRLVSQTRLEWLGKLPPECSKQDQPGAPIPDTLQTVKERTMAPIICLVLFRICPRDILTLLLWRGNIKTCFQ
jgi:hypothetical protein